MKSVLASLLVLAALPVFAHGKMHSGAHLEACKAPVAACEAAGYKVGAHVKGHKEGEDTGVWVDCIDAVADGKKEVPGLDRTAAQACKSEKKAKHDPKRG